jgi:pyruvate dehydrogenase E2 component (dihydrolipoamide acetyltransferase)
MAFDVVMPQMGESIAEATVLKWHKQVGDTIAKDETLYEISTDKVDAEIPAPSAGTLLEILVDVNKTVAVGTVVARIGAAGEKAASNPTIPVSAAQAAAASARPSDVTGPIAESIHPMDVEDDNSLEGRLKSKSSPLVREMAKQHNVDLRQITGTGQNGRVTKQDIEEFIAKGGQKPTPSSAPVSGVMPPMAAHDPSAPTMGVVPGLAVPPAPAMPAFAPGERVKVEPMSRMRKIIAENMIASKRVSPHVYTIFEIDMSNIARLRAKHRKGFEETYGTKLSFMPFIMKAVIKGLQAFPIVNSSIDGDNIVYKQDLNIGIAVALDWGLIVPVVKHADSLNLGGLARSLNDLAERARNKKLSPDEISGGTFTITNPGVFGDIFALPIINQPQVAIQAVGSIVKRPVVVTDEHGNDAIAIRQMMYSGLSFDHRVIDGAVGDQFMSVVKKELETGTFGLE